MSAAEKRAYVLADNKLALNAGWDEEILAEELKGLLAEDLDFDIGAHRLLDPRDRQPLEGLAPEEPGDPRRTSSRPRRRPAAGSGDLWQLGPHRLICGNALDPDGRGPHGRRAGPDGLHRPALQRADPGPCRRLGRHPAPRVRHGVGRDDPAEFIAFLRTAFERLVEASVDGSIHFICMDWRHMGEMLAAGEGVYAELKNLIVWAKDNGGMGTFYRSRHELIFAFKNGTAPHINSFELGQHGRYRTNVWHYKGVNTLRAGRMDELALHPTVKPVQLIADAIKDVSQRGGIVLDLFGGSGSTLIAAHKTGRRAYLCELDPLYCDRIIARWEAYAKDEAELIAWGNSAPLPGGHVHEFTAIMTTIATSRERRDRDGLGSETPDQGGPTKRRCEEPRPQDGGRRSYEVGYGKPPKHSRVVKGQILNPNGRRQGSKNKPKEASNSETRAIVLKSAKRTLRVNEAGEAVTVPMVEAVVRSLEMAALKGNVWAMWKYPTLVRACRARGERRARDCACGRARVQAQVGSRVQKAQGLRHQRA